MTVKLPFSAMSRKCSVDPASFTLTLSPPRKNPPISAVPSCTSILSMVTAAPFGCVFVCACGVPLSHVAVVAVENEHLRRFTDSST